MIKVYFSRASFGVIHSYLLVLLVGFAFFSRKNLAHKKTTHQMMSVIIVFWSENVPSHINSGPQKRSCSMVSIISTRMRISNNPLRI